MERIERIEGDTTVKKVDSRYSPEGEMGQTYLVSGKRMSMRLWREEPDMGEKEISSRAYETVGYVVEGKALLHIEGQQVRLEAGDSWLVPEGARHRYEIISSFVAVEATAPPSQVHERDSRPD